MVESRVITFENDSANPGNVKIKEQKAATILDGILYNIPVFAQFSDKAVTGTNGLIGSAAVTAALVAGVSKYTSGSWMPRKAAV